MRLRNRNIIKIKNHLKELNQSKSSPLIGTTNVKNESCQTNNNKYVSSLSDSRWVFNLRIYKKKPRDKERSIGSPPSFFDEDQKKYIGKMTLDRKNKIPFKRNLKEYLHIIENRTKMPLNSTTFNFETTLRENDSVKKESVLNNEAIWKSLVLSPKKNLLNDYLSPMLQASKNQLRLKNRFISRPFEQIYSEGFVNGEKILVKKFEADQSKTLRYPAEHYSSSPYNNKFNLRNLNYLRAIEKKQPINNELYKWNTSLRSLSIPHLLLYNKKE